MSKQGTGDGKAAAEKSKFAQTCNRLSTFLKEKGNLRDISSEINAKFTAAADPPKDVSELNPATTVDFLTNMNVRGEEEPQPKKNNLPEYVILDSSDSITTTSVGATQNMNSNSNSNSKTTADTTIMGGGQMSIFYKGKVMVVDDVPEDRARYVMLVAKNARVPPPHDNNNNKSSVEELLLMAASTSKFSQQQQQKNKDNGDVVLEEMINKSADSDLPIARRASLNKFLAKRKDRATVRAAAPYHHQLHHQLSPPAAAASPSSSERSFDLNM